MKHLEATLAVESLQELLDAADQLDAVIVSREVNGKHEYYTVKKGIKQDTSCSKLCKEKGCENETYNDFVCVEHWHNKPKQEESCISKCCDAATKIGGIGDFNDKDAVVTQYYVCTVCDEPCDLSC